MRREINIKSMAASERSEAVAFSGAFLKRKLERGSRRREAGPETCTAAADCVKIRQMLMSGLSLLPDRDGRRSGDLDKRLNHAHENLEL